MPLVRERKSTVFDYLKNAVLVIDEPAGIESYLVKLISHWLTASAKLTLPTISD